MEQKVLVLITVSIQFVDTNLIFCVNLISLTIIMGEHMYMYVLLGLEKEIWSSQKSVTVFCQGSCSNMTHCVSR